MKLQLSYEIIFGYVQKLQIAHLIPLKTINIVIYNKQAERQAVQSSGYLICPRCKEYSYVSHDKAATDGRLVGGICCCWQR